MGKTVHLIRKRSDTVEHEVRSIATSLFPDFEFSRYDQSLTMVRRLFSGTLPGFARCDTGYHDWAHTQGVVLATARLLHGVHLDRQAVSPHTFESALVAALFHDSGYIRREGENHGTGAQFTPTHVQRGIDLLEEHCARLDWPIEDFMNMECMIQCTDPAQKPDAIVFPNIETMVAGHVLGTADLVAQMADDVYLEKLPHLYREFAEAGVTLFADEYELFRKTADFHALMRTRMEDQLSDVIHCMPAHFDERHGVARDLYSEAVERNLDYLESILIRYGEQYRKGLRRSLDRAERPIEIAA